jgi:outer membrane lipoprotein SlyB
VVALSLALALTGCAATTTAISKRELDVQTKMTETIFLDPAPAVERTVFLEVRNTSDKPDFDIEPAVRAQIEGRGVRLVDDPTEARYLLQANVLQAGKTSKGAAKDFFLGGLGSAALGGAAGGAIAGVKSDNTAVIVGGAVAGAAVAAIADAFVQDVTYSVVTDIQVSERVQEGEVVTETMSADLPEGSAGSRVLSSTQTSDWKRYRTRVMTVANKVNLDFEDASPAMVDGLTHSIAGIF